MSYLQVVGSCRGDGTPKYDGDAKTTDKLLEACPVLRDVFKGGGEYTIKCDDPKLRIAMSDIDKYVGSIRRRQASAGKNETNDTDVTEPALKLRRTLHYAMQKGINLEACY